MAFYFIPYTTRLLYTTNRKLAKALFDFKSEQFQDYTNRLTTGDKSLWYESQQILKHKSYSFPLQKPDNTWAKSSVDKAEHFDLHLKFVYSLNPSTISPPPYKAFNLSNIVYTRHVKLKVPR